MKRIAFAVAAAAALLSCTSDVDVMPQTCDVTFICDHIEVETRTTLSAASLTDLWVWEGNTLLAHQVSTDSDFGVPTISLTHGSHSLTFVASKSEGQSLSNGVWSCSRVKDTFCKAMSVNVAGGTAVQNVELSRRNAQVCFVIEDAVPSSVKTMHIKAGNYLSLDAALAGAGAATYDVSVDISGKVGVSGYDPFVTLLPESLTGESQCDVMIEFLSPSNAVLYHYERTVPVQPNRVTSLKGRYFSSGSTTLSVDTSWSDSLDVSLFGE